MSKGIDYSKWDKMQFDTDSSDGTLQSSSAAPAPDSRVEECVIAPLFLQPKPRNDPCRSSLTSETAKVSIAIDKPQQGEGSAWNVSNFHWEEQNLDK